MKNLNFEEQEVIAKSINHLETKQAKVLTLRFFDDATLKEIAKEIGLSSEERARQIESKALRTLNLGIGIPPEIHEQLKKLL